MSSANPGGKGKGELVYPQGFSLNPKTGEIRNVKFSHIENGVDVVFVGTSDASEVSDLAKVWKDVRQFDEDCDALVELASVDRLGGIEEYARKHGPLFGQTFAGQGVIKEPVGMWYAAIALLSSGLSLKAACDTGRWLNLQDEIASFELEIKGLSDYQKRQCKLKNELLLRDNQPYLARAIMRFRQIPDDYWRSLLSPQEHFRGMWVSKRWDGSVVRTKVLTTKPQPLIGVFDKTPEDFLQTQIDQSHPTLEVVLPINHAGEESTVPPDLDSIFIPLEQFGGVANGWGVELCRMLLESLISLHCRSVHYDWMERNFSPMFFERLRHLWFLLSILLDRQPMDFCSVCGTPFPMTRENRKYCSRKCGKKAMRKSGK